MVVVLVLGCGRLLRWYVLRRGASGGGGTGVIEVALHELVDQRNRGRLLLLLLGVRPGDLAHMQPAGRSGCGRLGALELQLVATAERQQRRAQCERKQPAAAHSAEQSGA